MRRERPICFFFYLLLFYYLLLSLRGDERQEDGAERAVAGDRLGEPGGVGDVSLYGVTAAGAYVILQLTKREHRETRFARAVQPIHGAHHGLRDAAYERYIMGAPETAWSSTVEASLQQFAAGFSVATGAACHATIKRLDDPGGAAGRSAASSDDLVVETYLRSASRSTTLRPGVPANTVGRNSDYRQLLSPDADNRCWHHDDLLQLDPALYDNPHWPERPTRKNVPYRTTMVWPIRKVILDGTTTSPREVYIHGFLTVDSTEPGVFDYERHFELGAAYADHLLSVLWEQKELRNVHGAVVNGTANSKQKNQGPGS